MQSDMVKFFALQRQVFGICPCCGQFFRLSDCTVFLKRRPVTDWMDELEKKQLRIDRGYEKLAEIQHELREAAREKGRRLARKTIRKVDPIFTPRRLDPDDAKVLFHPVDYIVFDGMKNKKAIRRIVLLDREARNKQHRTLQRSIEKTLERENYEWATVQIGDDGSVKVS